MPPDLLRFCDATAQHIGCSSTSSISHMNTSILELDNPSSREQLREQSRKRVTEEDLSPTTLDLSSSPQPQLSPKRFMLNPSTKQRPKSPTLQVTGNIRHRRTGSTLAAQSDLNLSFSGCGFLGIYHVGVASCFSEYAPQLSMHKIAGSSAGALVAVAHICGNLQLAYCTTDILRVAIEARARALGPFHPSFDIQALVGEALNRGLPEDVHEKANGKLHVSLTRVDDGANVIINQFESKEDVIQVLLCSCFIPFWSGLKPPKYKGVTYVDGGFSNNLLVLDEKTVKVSPFAGEADICPQDDTFNLLQVNLSNTSFSLSPDNLYRIIHALLPPPPEVLSKLCEQGFADGIRYLQRMKLISCTKCLEIRSSLLVTTNGGDMEEAFVSATDAAGNQCNADKDNNSEWGNQSDHHPHHPNADTISYTSSISGLLDSPAHSIRLEQQEQKMIEITEDRTRRNSVVSTTSQKFHKSQQPQQTSSCATTTKTTTTTSSTYQTPMNHGNDINTQNATSTNKRPPIWLHSVVSETIEIDTCDIVDMDDFDEINCDECAQMRQETTSFPMPKQFSDRIRDACDTVNKSLYNWLCSHRPIKYLAYLVAPYYLPIDVSLALIYKCWQSMPQIRKEFVECIYYLVDFLIGMLRRMPTSKSTSSLLMSSSSTTNWETAAAEYEKELLKNSKSIPAYNPQVETIHNITCNGSAQQPTIEQHQNLSKSDESSHQITGGSEHHHHSQQQQHHHSPHSLEDTFDSIVDVTSRQEARIFAYYFRDAKNRLQVTEIFDLERAASSSNSLSSGLSQAIPNSPVSANGSLASLSASLQQSRS